MLQIDPMGASGIPRNRVRAGWVSARVDIRTRYMYEPKLHAVVDRMVSMLVAGHIDTSDLANAAVLASQLYAERYGAPAMIRLDAQTENDLVQLQRDTEARLVRLRAGKLGAPGVRDPNARCDSYDPSERKPTDLDDYWRYAGAPKEDGHFDQRMVDKGMFPAHIGPAGAQYSDGTIIAPAADEPEGA